MEKFPLNKKRSIGGILAVVFSVAIIIILVYHYDAKDVWHTAYNALSPHLIFATALVLLAHIFLASERLRLVLWDMGLKLKVSEGILIRMGCSPMKLLVPLKAGELLKPFYLSRNHSLPFASGLSAIVFDKLIVLISLVPFMLLAAILSGHLFLMIWAGILFICTVLLFVSGFRNLLLKLAGFFGERIHGLAVKLLSSFEAVSVKSSLQIIFYTVILNAIEIYLFFVCFEVTGVSTGIIQDYNAIFIAQMAGLLPFFVSGIGGREAALLLYLGNGTNESAILAGGILFSVFGRMLIHFLGLLWMPKFLSKIFQKNG